MLEGKDGSVFERKPSEMIRIFSVAIAFDIPLSLRTREMMGELAASRGEALRADPDSGRASSRSSATGATRANPSRLEQMQDLGLLAALMPEWEPSTGRVQHDIYHVYTVDQHALYAVGRLHALGRGDHADQFRTPTETVREVTRPVALAVGTLLHDVGKPYGSPHSEIGAGLAVTICRRLGIDEDDIRRIEFLVRQHLVMGQMSQRRDLDDLGMIADFATLCGDEENLRELYLLTFCDLASVAPDAMSELEGDAAARALHAHAEVHEPRAGPAGRRARRDRQAPAEARGGACWARSPRRTPRSPPLFGGFPDRYFAENTALRIAAHIRLHPRAARSRRRARSSRSPTRSGWA